MLRRLAAGSLVAERRDENAHAFAGIRYVEDPATDVGRRQALRGRPAQRPPRPSC
jgi:hypothetical protein